MIRRTLVWICTILAGTVLAVIMWTALWPMTPADEFSAADVIIVFGAGMKPDGTLDVASHERITRGVALFEAGRAPRLHFTGGKARPQGPSAGERMAEVAIASGIPPAAITTEGRSQSTLQNALFSLPQMTDVQSAILVSEAFHLPRVAASNWWAGGPGDVQLAASSRARAEWRSTGNMILREALAWWFNVARALAFDVASLMGVEQSTREGWLA